MNLSSTGSTVANFDTNFECTFAFEPQHSLCEGMSGIGKGELEKRWEIN